MSAYTNVPCVTSQPGPWDDDGGMDYYYDEATKEWESLWQGEPNELDYSNKYTFRTIKREWLVKVADKIITEYDGNLTDIEDFLSEFYDKWVEARAQQMYEDAVNEAEEARSSSREDWGHV